MKLLNNSPGYTYLEMTLSLFVLSIMFSAFMTIYVTFSSQNQIADTKNSMKTIQTALDQFLLNKGYLPCPASQTAAWNSSSFGVATNCAASAPAGTVDYGSGSTAIRIGTIPFKALNLPQEITIDSWNNRYAYVVVKSLATDASTFISTNPTGAISVVDTNNNTIVSSGGTAYILVSYGPYGNGSYSAAGKQNVACGTNKGTENCNNDNVFRIAPYNEGKTSSQFVDFLAWKTRAQLIKDNQLAIAP